MKVLRRVLYLVCFVGLAASAALALDGAVRPSMSMTLLWTVVLAAVCGAAGLVHRKAWGVSLVLLPLGAYVLMRTLIPPTPDVEGIGGLYRFYVDRLAMGGSQYMSKYFPLSLPGAPELRLLMAFSLYWATAAASFFALSLRRALPGVALLLLVLGFGFTVDVVPRVLPLAVLFFVLAACLLMFSRSLERRAWRLREAVPGIAVAAAGSLLAIVLLGAAPSAAAAPWQDWRAWNPFGRGGSIYSFNWLQNYPQLLNPANNMMMMKVESPLPSYWRANALDSFTGDAWVSSQSFLNDIDRVRKAGGYEYSIPTSDPVTKGREIIERFEVRSVYTNYFFIGGDPRSLSVDQDVILRMNDMRALHVVDALGPSLDYSISAVIPTVTPASLVGLGADYPEAAYPYLELPFPRLAQLDDRAAEAAWQNALEDGVPDGWQWAGLYSLNHEIVGDAVDPYEIVLRLEKHLRRNYTYTLEPPASDYPSPYAAFLFDTRAGYCQHFAGVMATLLRFNGVPARVAVGFTTGDREAPGVYSVATNNAHAWVEAYFPTVGWVAFDPTPGRSLPNAGGSSTSPGFSDPFAADTSTPTTATTAAPPADLPDRQDKPEPAKQAPSGSWTAKLAWLPWVLGIAALLTAWPLGRRFWRERGLRGGTLDQRFAASLRLLRGTLSAYGVAPMGSRTFEEVLEIVETHLGLKADPVFTARTGAILFGGRHARTEDCQRAETFRREVELRLRRRHGRAKTLLTWYGVRRPAPALGAATGGSAAAEPRLTA
jgi:transglutaminase-like putative cysteine protease